MKRIFALAALSTAIACSSTPKAETKPGNPEVYASIAAQTNCTKLQESFDTSMENHDRYPAGDSRREAPLAYANAADERMKELNCY